MLPQMSLQDAYQDFLLACQARRYSAATLRFYRTQLPPFLTHCNNAGIQTPSQVTAALIRRYLVGLQDRGLKDTSQHAAARAIRRYLRFCAEEQYIEQVPRFAMPKLSKKIQAVLTIEQTQALVKACRSNRDRALILVALDTGMRAEELVSLTPDNIDITRGAIVVRGGKGQKDRYVHIGIKTRRALIRHLSSRRQRQAGKALWPHQYTGEALTKWGIRELCDRLSERLGFKFTPHTLRRTAATLALKAGMPLPMVQAMLGHENLSTTERYLAFSDDDRREAHERFGAVDNFLD